jgi:hypothetical protein
MLRSIRANAAANDRKTVMCTDCGLEIKVGDVLSKQDTGSDEWVASYTITDRLTASRAWYDVASCYPFTATGRRVLRNPHPNYRIERDGLPLLKYPGLFPSTLTVLYGDTSEDDPI